MQLIPFIPSNSGRLDNVNNIDLELTTVQSVSVQKQINEFWKKKTKTKHQFFLTQYRIIKDYV